MTAGGSRASTCDCADYSPCNARIAEALGGYLPCPFPLSNDNGQGVADGNRPQDTPTEGHRPDHQTERAGSYDEHTPAFMGRPGHSGHYMASPPEQDAGAAMPMSPKTHRPPGIPKPGEAAKRYAQSDKAKEAKRFYAGRRWRRLRRMVLAGKPLCERCKLAVASEVHHQADRLAQPDLAYDMGNLEALCLGCHGKARGGRMGKL